MNIETLGAAVVSPSRGNEPAQQIDRKRQESRQQPPSTAQEQKKAQPEELLKQIKALTEEGLYSVRFERDSSSEQLIVKIVDSTTDEVVRQIPPEELINLTKRLNELSGNLVNTIS
jgi:flagellar protein FlaG